MARRWGRIGVPVVAHLLAFFVVGPSSPSVEGRTKGQDKKPPHLVLIIRHAEKPPEEAGSVHLTPDGKRRAATLPEMFKASEKRRDPIPTPDFIFAARNSKRSHRSVETVTVLAKNLKLAVNSKYRDEDFAKLVHEIFENPKYGGKTILICWHHGTAPQLAKGLKAADAPNSWKGGVFDRVWQITYDKHGTAAFRDRPQQLLAQDSDK